MGRIIVHGGRTLTGNLKIQGSKNAVLPMLAACVLCDGCCTIYNCPVISDVDDALEIIRELGGKTHRGGNILTVDARDISGFEIQKSLMHKMRSSVMFLGPILARTGRASVYAPGGCEIGNRPIDIHISAIQKMGASVEQNDDRLDCVLGEKFSGDVRLPFPSVGATENIMMAAALGNGTVTVYNAAKEPEILALQGFINAMGGNVSGAGTDTVRIEGVRRLRGTEYTVPGDRIVCATYLMAVAATAGKACFTGVTPRDLSAVLKIMEYMGCSVYTSRDEIHLKAPKRLCAANIVETEVFPGFPTDAQAPFSACAAVAMGTTNVVENIFENRFRHMTELCKMGAKIRLDGKKAIIEGVPGLHGADLCAKELRGAGALVIAGTFAEGRSCVTGIEYLDRGYESIENALSALNANVIREE
ncbi:MAG: UDP-N-acetylglucosamine 1-carboxyvinyltransferase [Clostridia bacterium]|nr:UDP-N-acetylglucosamine 1-carboxyvinyltransferase [Clostridia bacterium]